MIEDVIPLLRRVWYQSKGHLECIKTDSIYSSKQLDLSFICVCVRDRYPPGVHARNKAYNYSRCPRDEPWLVTVRWVRSIPPPPTTPCNKQGGRSPELKYWFARNVICTHSSRVSASLTYHRPRSSIAARLRLEDGTVPVDVKCTPCKAIVEPLYVYVWRFSVVYTSEPRSIGPSRTSLSSRRNARPARHLASYRRSAPPSRCFIY